VNHQRRVIFTARALREIEAAEQWWRANRDKAPSAFTEETAAACTLIASNPTLGKLVPGRREGVRRLPIPRIRYYLYYRIRTNGDIEILSLWHTSRGRTPRL
jgi:plasmid stabilization system protein ParE